MNLQSRIGGTGVTTGGIKQFCAFALYRALLREVKPMVQPKNTITEPIYWQGDLRSFLLSFATFGDLVRYHK